MPELPEVETTKTSLLPLVGQSVISVQTYRPNLREPIARDLDTLAGFVLQSVVRRAKYLLLYFFHPTDRTQKTLLVHLGMSGSLLQYDDSHERDKHDHIIFKFGNLGNTTLLCYHDPRRFGMVVWASNDAFIDNKDSMTDRYLSQLGIEPLDDEFTGAYLYRHIHHKPKSLAKPIKTLIMDQKVVVGVGNIYAAESLFLANIHPNTPANHLTQKQLDSLVAHIKAILQKAIVQGGSTLKDFKVADNKTGYFQQTLLVYGQAGKPCPTCGTVLQNIKLSGRASVFCPKCQPLSNF